MPKQNTYFNFEKVSKRTHLDIASVNSAISFELSGNKMLNVHAATGGVFAFPRYLEKTCAYLNGKEITTSTILSASKILQTEISPISDARGTLEYKRLLARQLFFAHFIEIFSKKIKTDELFENEMM